MADDLDGKVALVTGAARDRWIGRGIALALARTAPTSRSTTSGSRTRRPTASPRSSARAARESSRQRRRPVRLRAAGRETVGGLGRARHLLRQRRRGALAEARRRHRGGVRPDRRRSTSTAASSAARRRRPDAPARRGGRIMVTSSVNAVCPSPRSASTARPSTRSPTGVGDGPRVGGRRDHGQPRRAGLGGLEHQRSLADFATDERGRRYERRSRCVTARPSRPRSETRWRTSPRPARGMTTGAYLRVDGGSVIGKY